MTVVKLVSPTQIMLPLDSDASEIGRLYQLARTSLFNSVRHYAECGQKLIAKKEQLKHGEWMPWLTANADALGMNITSTPQRLMQLARDSASTQNLNEITAITINRKLWGNDKVRGTQGTGENEWYTPADIIQAAQTVLGAIDLDPASSEHAQRTVQASKYFTLADDGLTQPWHGSVFLNPPYAQPHIENFADKMIAEVAACRVKTAIMLTHNYTDTAWFQKLAVAASAICFTRGRIRFEAPNGELAAPTQGQAFFFFGNQPGRFYEVFRPFGFIARVVK